MLKWFGVLLDNDGDASDGTGGANSGTHETRDTGGKESEPSDQEPSDREQKLADELKARDAEIELLKRDRDGQNKKVGELAKEIDAIKKAAMSDEERKKAEEVDRLKRAEEEQGKFLDQCVALAAQKSGIKTEDSFLLTGKDQEEIFKKSDRLKALLADAEQAGFERAKKDQTKGTPPAGGGPSEGGTTVAALADGAVVFRCPNRWPKRPRPTIPRNFSIFSRPPAPPTT